MPQTGYLELKDSAGHAEMAVVSAEEVYRCSAVSVQLTIPFFFLLDRGEKKVSEKVNVADVTGRSTNVRGISAAVRFSRF